MKPYVLVLLLMFGCQDYSLINGADDPAVRPENAPLDPMDPPRDTGTPIVPVETGDSGWLPANCEVTVAPVESIPIVDVCQGEDGSTPIVDAFNLVVEHHWASPGSGVIAMPAIGNLTDDNGDGLVNALDNPDIAFTDLDSNTLVALSGDTGAVLFSLPDFDGNAGTAIADVDGDGNPEIVAIRRGKTVAAVDGQGNIRWISEAFGLNAYPQPTVADLDGDGLPEIVADMAVINGEDGSTVTTLSLDVTSWRTPVVADLDQDGFQEIILANRVFDHLGQALWTSTASGASVFAAVVDVDGDPEAEIIMVTTSTMLVHDTDGTLLRTNTIPGTNPGPPAVADFDGDRQVEIAIPANNQLSVFELDGALLWQQPINDSSGMAGCSGFDLNGDFAWEVLYADQFVFRIYDGRTGAVLFQFFDHASGTLWEYPVVADIDLDGSAEICIASNWSWVDNGLTCLGHAGSGWPRAGSNWGVHDFTTARLEPDGSVPSHPTPSWQQHNLFRARPAVDDPAQADLSIEISDLCVASCETGPIKVVVRAANQGGATVPAGVDWSLQRDDDGVFTVLASGTLPQMDPGTAAAGVLLELSPEEAGTGLLRLVIDEADLIIECDESNNTFSLDAPLCGQAR